MTDLMQLVLRKSYFWPKNRYLETENLYVILVLNIITYFIKAIF